MEKIMAVYDVDPEYARRFADVVNQKEKVPFTVVPFSSLETLREYGTRHRIELLLVSDVLSPKEISGVEAGSVVTLSDGEKVPVDEGYPCVYKYQSADSLIREVMTRYCDQPAEELFAVVGKRARVLGIYSPLGRCMKTSLALIMGQEMSRDGKTLYVGFEEFSGFSRLLGEETDRDLSDVLYFLRQGEWNVVRLRSLVYTWKDIDYIAPVRYPEDLEQMSGAEAAELLERLASESGYSYLVVDVGRPGRDLIPVLECCDVIYMPVKEDGLSAARLEEFDRYLEAAGREGLRQRICRVKPPGPRSVKQGNYLEQLLWGEFGDYVRKLLRGGPA